jgi:esterase/lipase superfamily enzyme
MYGSDRGPLDFGFCDVSIPRDHQMGEVEAPSIWRFELRESPERHVMLLRIGPQSQAGFIDSIRSRISSSRKKEALVFVHGFNVSFRDAARRTAQITYDLGFDGAPILYSWPSRGELSEAGYRISLDFYASSPWSPVPARCT